MLLWPSYLKQFKQLSFICVSLQTMFIRYTAVFIFSEERYVSCFYCANSYAFSVVFIIVCCQGRNSKLGNRYCSKICHPCKYSYGMWYSLNITTKIIMLGFYCCVNVLCNVHHQSTSLIHTQNSERTVFALQFMKVLQLFRSYHMVTFLCKHCFLKYIVIADTKLLLWFYQL